MTRRHAFGPATLSLHAGQSPDSDHGARGLPIHYTTSYVFADADQAAGRFDMSRTGHVYSRLSNPTNAVLEERIAALEGGIGAIATASGQAALHLAIVTLTGAGGHIVASRALYGGSHNLLRYTLPRFGIRTTFVDPRDPAAWADAITSDTVLLFGESIGNPGLEVLDIPALADIAHACGLPLMVDATLVTPCLQRPIDLGADLVVHSATKYLGGHGVAVGGLLVDGGRFDWHASGRFPTLTEPYEGFHDMQFVDESPVAAFLLRARREGLRDFGACLSPMNAFQILQGIETLPLRMRQHVDNARRVAAFLDEQAMVTRVGYPGLAHHPDQARVAELLPGGPGAIVTIELAGERAVGVAFIDALRVFSHVANVGDAKSLVIHPASTTHSRMSAEDLAAAGIGEGTVRLSIGLEDADDLIADLERALRAAAKAAGQR
jgi:O-acetylhomoserine (thiol)-lyase